MPLPERVIEPVAVCRGTLQFPVPDELEGVTNGSLANIIRQLSFLSRHAEEMFGNLFQEAEGLAVRGSNLQARIDKIAVKVTQLDSNVEEVTLQEIQLRKAFRSSQTFDQQVVSRETMPKSMLEQYLSCDRPPPLDKLNPYREDGKDGIKFYTDANYFFDLWKSEMLQSTEKAEKGRRGGIRGSRPEGGRHKKRVRQPHNTAERQRQKVLTDGEYIMSHRANHGYSVRFEGDTNGMDSNGGYDPPGYDPGRIQHRPNSIEIQGLQNSGWAGSNLAPEEASRMFQQTEPIYTSGIPRILRAPGDQPERQPHVQFDMSHLAHQYIQDPSSPASSDHSRGGTPQRRPSVPPPAPPPGSSPMHRNAPRDSLPPPPPPPSNEVSALNLNGPMPNNSVARVSAATNNRQSPLSSPHFSPQPSHQDPDLPPPPPAPDQLSARVPPSHLAPSPPPPPAPNNQPAPPAPPPPPPPPPTENGLTKPNGDVSSPIKSSPPKSLGLPGTITSPPGLKKPKPIVRPHTEDNVRSDLLKAIRDGISLKKTEQNEAKDKAGQGLSDVASILARRVAVEFSDSDDCPSDSEYDSDDWGETEA